MIIDRDYLDDILHDDKNLKNLRERVEQGYSWLAARCAFAMGGFGDDPDGTEDDDEDETEEDVTPSDSTEVAENKQLVTSDFFVDLEMSDEQYEEEEYEFDSSVIPPKDQKPQDNETLDDLVGQLGINDLFKLVKQISHPDKIMRFSAKTKEEILAVFHECKEWYEDENLDALIFCYVRVCLLRGEPHRIGPKVAKYAVLRHRQIKRHMAFIMDKPFMPAILAWFEGEHETAIKLFKLYLKEEKLVRERKAEQDMDDEEYFADDD